MPVEPSKGPGALAVGRDPGWERIVVAALEPFGFTVVPAKDLDEVNTALRQRAFDLAVVALGEPGDDLAAALARAVPGLLVVGAEAGVTLTRVAGQVREAARSALVRLAGHLAHDLNNPLGGLKLYVRLLERSLADAKTDEAVDLAGKIGRAVDQLAGILAGIRSYDRVPPSERAATRLGTVVEECLGPPSARPERGGT